MPTRKEIERLGGLFEQVAAGARPFLDKCSETKFLAVVDFGRAVDEYRSLTRQVFGQCDELTTGWKECGECLSTVRAALENELIGREVLEALTELRGAYVNRVLKPAVRGFLSGEASSAHDVGNLYGNVLRLDGLLDAARFLKNLGQT